MSFNNQLEEFNKNGLVVLPKAIDSDTFNDLRNELEIAIKENKKQRPNVFDAGMIHNCMFRGQKMSDLLDCQIMNQFLALLLSNTFIVYAYQSSSLLGGADGVNYGSRVHVDSPRFIKDYLTNVGVIFALNDFTLENGATHYIKGSHKKEELTKQIDFYKNATRATCKAGDMIVFHGRLHHAAGKNTTQQPRHALTINFCRSFMRQRFDYPRMLTKCKDISFSENTKQRLGWNVRVPTSLDEFYLPEEERLYKPNQG